MPLRLLEVDSATDHQNHVFRLCGDPTVTALPPAPLNTQLDILRSKMSFPHRQLSNAVSLIPLWLLKVDSATDH